jgi:hypothetical protein
MSRYLIYFCCCHIFFTSCAQVSKNKQEAYLLSNIEVDSFRIYETGESTVDKFTFSPLNKNAVWLGEQCEKFEIDLKTGKKQLLMDFLGEKSINITKIDSYEENSFVYLNSQNECFFYNNKEKIKISLEENINHPVVYFESNLIWFGWRLGLKKYNRATKQLEKIEGFSSVSYPILPFNALNGDLLINNTIVFHPNTNKWEYRASNGDCKDMNYHEFFDMHLGINGIGVMRYTDKSNNLITIPSLGKYYGQVACAKQSILWTRFNYSQDTLWFNWYDYAKSTYGQLSFQLPENTIGICRNYKNLLIQKLSKGWVIGNKLNKTTCFVAQLLPEKIDQLEMDSRNIYLLGENKFMVISFDWLLKNGLPLSKYAEENKVFNKMYHELFKDIDLEVEAKKRQQIVEIFKKSSNPFIAEKIKQLTQNLYGNVNFEQQNDIDFVNAEIKKGNLDSLQTSSFYNKISRFYARKLEIKKAKFYSTKYCNFTKQKPINAFPKFVVFCQKLDSLKNTKPSEDAFMYSYAKILYDYAIRNDDFESSSMYDVSYAETQYQKLIKKYPNSPWADDAEFDDLMIQLYHYCEGGCSYNMNDLKRLDNFISKYPTSEHIPEILCSAASICIQSYDENPEIQTKNARIGLTYLTKIKENYPEFLDNESYKQIQKEYDNFIPLHWKVCEGTSKTKYKSGETISFVLTLQNINDTAQVFTTQLANDYPVFSMAAYYMSDDGCSKVMPEYSVIDKFEESAPNKQKDIKIEGKEIKNWNFDLRKFTFQFHSAESIPQICTYNFSKKGNYFVSVFCTQPNSYGFQTKEVQFYVE